MARLQPGGPEKREVADMAGVRVSRDLPVQHGWLAAGEVPPSRRRDRRAPCAGCVKPRGVCAMPDRGGTDRVHRRCRRLRSEERRVGKEWRCGWSAEGWKKRRVDEGCG